jgi:Domain of unknown function (DUF4397)
MRKLVFSLLIIGMIVGGVFAQEEDEKANIRIAHLSSDAGEVDISLSVDDTMAVQETLEFGDVSDWSEVDLGTYSLAVVSTDEELEDAILETELELEAGDWITLAIIGEVEKETLALQPLIEDYSPLGAYQSRLSVFHAVSNYDPVNVIVNDVELIRYLGYPGFWGPDSDGFITFDILAQTSDIRVEQEGGNITAELEDIVLGGNRHYFFAIAGTPDDPQFVFVATDLEPVMSEEE